LHVKNYKHGSGAKLYDNYVFIYLRGAARAQSV